MSERRLISILTGDTTPLPIPWNIGLAKYNAPLQLAVNSPCQSPDLQQAGPGTLGTDWWRKQVLGFGVEFVIAKDCGVPRLPCLATCVAPAPRP